MSRLPVSQPYTVTTQFGVPDSNAKFGRHSGIDYAVSLNRPIYAPTSGELTNIQSPTGGNMVQIFDGEYYHRLMHNTSFSRGNGRVEEGNEVAKAGTTGLSTGVHSHWDISTEKTPTSFASFIDPNVWLNSSGQGEAMTAEDKSWISTELNKRDQRMDRIEKLINDLNNTLDTNLKAISKKLDGLANNIHNTDVRVDKLEGK